MTLDESALRAALAQVAKEQAPTMDRLRTALGILYRDRAGGRSVDKILEIVLLSVARAHARRTQEALDTVQRAMSRVLADVAATRQRGGPPATLRGRALRESDLKAIARATDDLLKFEDAVKRRIAAHDESLGRTVQEALPPTGPAPSAAAPVGALNRALSRGDDLRGLSESVLEAWRSGHTLPERGRRFVVARPDEPRLVAAMRRLEDAIEAYRKNPGDDAAAAAAAADRLRRAYAEANETLRAAAGDFDAVVTGDVLPGKPLSPDAPPRVGAHAEAAARAEAVRAELTAHPGLVDAPRPELLEKLHLSDLEVLAEGDLREPIKRGGYEKSQLSPSQLGKLRATVPPGLAARLRKLFEGWQRAHLVGPGFGSELVEGIMLAPHGVNQLLQNEGVEAILRAAHAAGADVPLTVSAKGRRLVIPLADGTTEFVDVLTSVHYEVAPPGKPKITLDVTVHADGSWSATHHDTLKDVWPADVPLADQR